ncbi:hypothetical protein ISD49_17840 [Pseudomonas aeruginosa]|nr:hypothetical protein [Pseudomonas aeruginosa]QQW18073.1 hypothetical protein HUS13_26915 [Pseudomonas aeruginosa]
MRTIPLGERRHKRRAKRSTGWELEKRGSGAAWSGRQIEAMPAEQAKVVSQDVAIKLVAKLSAEGAATDATGQSAEDGTGD